jgi:predicted methyltransferase
MRFVFLASLLSSSAAAVLLTACAPAQMATSAATPAATTLSAADYAAVLADPVRPAADRERDAARQPAALLAFAGIRPGMRVGDFVMGGGYFTRVLSSAVGSSGHVYAFQPAEFIAFRAQYGADQQAVDTALANVDAVNGPAGAPAFPGNLDSIITIQNFHDLFLPQMPVGTPANASAALFAALKPGGTLVVVDHAAVAGSGSSAAGTLHRIEQSAIVSTLTQAGFVLEAEGALFNAPADPHTANVFTPEIRGHTDQFTLRFRKPAR